MKRNNTDWKQTTLEEMAILAKDTWKVGDATEKYIGLEHIEAGTLCLNSVGNSLDLASNKFRFQAGDILFGKLRPYFRKVVMPRFSGVCSTDIWVIGAKKDYDQNFLFYFMANQVLIDKSMGASKGSHMPRADWNFLSRTVWQVPLLDEQRSIAAVLSSLDDKIELLRAQNKTLEEMAQRLFKEWFVDFNFPNEDGKPYKKSGGRMIESEMGEIPEGWRVDQVKKLADILSGFAFRSNTFSNDGLYKLVTIRNVQDGEFVSQTKDRLEATPENMPDYCHLQSGDILLSLTGNVGRVCQVTGNDFLLNQRVAKLQARQKQDRAFVYFFFRQPEIIGLLENLSSGTAQQNLSPIKTGEMLIILPTRSVLDQFAEVGNSIVDKVVKNKEQTQSLSSLRDGLLPKLMSGDINL